jgi:hypothetical protein
VIAFQGLPGQIAASRAFFQRADAVQPAVAGGKIAARIADVGKLQQFEGLQDVFAETLFVGQRRLGLVDAAVNAASQVFGKTAEDIGIDLAQGPLQVDFDLVRRSTSPCCRVKWPVLFYNQVRGRARGEW